MKIIAEQFLSVLVEDIINEKKEVAVISGKTYTGITGEELWREVEKRMGKDWVVNDSRPKLSRSDVNAIANARFYKQAGQKLLMGMAIIILVLAIAARYIPLNELTTNIYYVVCGVIALSFVIIYSRKQAKVRHELRWKLGVKDTEEI